MFSVEGLWCFQTTSYDDLVNLKYGGVVALETGRVFGGDSFMAYVGTYQMHDSGIRATIQSWQWNLTIGDGVENVFGMKAPIKPYTVVAEMVRVDDRLEGSIHPQDDPDAQLPIRMIFIKELP